MPQGKINYPLSEKLSILKIYQENDLNLTKTAKETKVDKNTISKWYKIYGKRLEENPVESEMITEISEVNREHKISLLSSFWETQDKLLARIKAQISRTTSITQLVQVMDTLDGIMSRWEGKPSESSGTTNLNFYTQINKMANDKKNQLQGNK